MHPKSQSGKTKSPITTKIRTYVDPLPSNAIPDISEKPERPPPKTKNERFYARHNYVPLDDEEAELDIKFPDNKCYMCHQCEKQTRFKKKASLRYIIYRIYQLTLKYIFTSHTLMNLVLNQYDAPKE